MINNDLIDNYANSAFNIAKKTNSTDVFNEEFNKVNLSLSQDLIKELSNPTISEDILSDIALEIANKLALSEDVSNFFQITIRNRRTSLLPAIITKFSEIYKKDQNIIVAKIYVVNKISDKYIDRIRLLISKKYQNKIIEIDQIIKKDILGGIVIKIGSELIDSSLKNSLNQLRLELQQTIN